MAYLRGGDKLALLAVSGGTESTLLAGGSVIGPPVWSADSRSLYVAGAVDGITAIWEVSILGGEPQMIAAIGRKELGRFWFDIDGEQIVFTRLESSEADIWVVELEGRP